MTAHKRWIGTAIILILLAILLDAVCVRPHIYYWWHGVVGFDALYGFLACIVLVKFAKGLGRLFIQREENYYDGGEDDHD